MPLPITPAPTLLLLPLLPLPLPLLLLLLLLLLFLLLLLLPAPRCLVVPLPIDSPPMTSMVAVQEYRVCRHKAEAQKDLERLEDVFMCRKFYSCANEVRVHRLPRSGSASHYLCLSLPLPLVASASLIVLIVG